MKPLAIRSLQISLLAVALAAPRLPPLLGALALLALWAVGFYLFRPPRRERWVGLLALGVATCGLAFDGWTNHQTQLGPEGWRTRAAAGYAHLWTDLDAEATAAARVVKPPTQTTERAVAFERLAAFAAREAGFWGEIERALGVWDRGQRWRHGRRSFLLVDPDGQPVVWAGEGLLHELAAAEVPRVGRRAKVGFGAVTLFSIQPLGGERRPWRLIAGASYPTETLPIRGAWAARRWSVRTAEEGDGALGSVEIRLVDSPTLVVDASGVSSSPRSAPTAGARVAWAALAFGLLALAALRATGRAIPSATSALEIDWGRLDGAGKATLAGPRPIVPLAIAGLVAAVASAAVEPAVAVAAAACGLLGYGTWWVSGRSTGKTVRFPANGTIAVFLAGMVAALGVTIAPLAIQHAFGPLDLSAEVFAAPAVQTLRLGLAAMAAGLLALAGWLTAARKIAPRVRHAFGWIAAGAFLVAGLIPDRALGAVAALGVGAILAALWFDREALHNSTTTAAAFWILSSLAASAGGEVAYRARLRAFAVRDLPPLLAPASPATRNEARARLERHFATEDLTRVAPRASAGVEVDDLAYTLWRRSPLARADALSALVIEPFAPTVGAERSTFSFGVPIDDASGGLEVGEVSAETVEAGAVESQAGDPWWRARIEGSSIIRSAGKPWGRARFVLALRPGSPAGEPVGVGDVDVGLLRGGPAVGRIERFPTALRFGVYTREGRAITSPWEEAPALPTSALSDGEHQISTPSGPALAVVGSLGRTVNGSREDGNGWGVIFLPRLGAVAALERVGNGAVGTLALALAAALFALAAALPRSAVRDLLVRAVRSYSKRLLLIYGVLLLVPLVLLNWVLIRSFERRLAREQRSAGAAALATAQKSLAATLDALEPGYSIDTALGDRRLVELAELIHREVNLYWGASVYASSKHELFTSGLLPERIPGEIFSGLALAGEAFSSRINQSGGGGAGGARYLEIYAPVQPAGESADSARLFLSVPLLAQQEEAAIELAHIRRQAFLVTVALIALLAAVGGRLARNFTRPIRDLVEGTHRIAGGARALGFAPGDLELAALGRAIDDMAERIAEGREQLVREKQVVERMVDNITSAVVSLDVERRVLMHNRVAKELLGVSVGRALAEALAAEARLAPVARFVREAVRGEAAKRTIRLAPPALAAGDSSSASSASAGALSGGEREWTLVWVPVPGAGEPAALLVVEDATEELRGQRLLAWAEMARIIAHEIKNPLTPIRLSTEHLREVWQRDKSQFDGVFERCTTNILHQVDELRQIALEFSTYSSVPRIDPVPADLVARLEELVAGYRSAPPEGIEIVFEAAEPTLAARFDARLLGRAVRNLIENALRASAGGGRVVVRVERTGDAAERARISIADRGPGVSPELLPRIFDPYFSTHDTGTGLGLPIARRIAEEHGGTIAARNRDHGGLEVAIEIPLG